MTEKIDQSTVEAIAAGNPGIENRMVVLPIDALEQNNSLIRYAQARKEERENIQEMRRAGLGTTDVTVFDSIVRF
jgi:hypothetical protein